MSFFAGATNFTLNGIPGDGPPFTVITGDYHVTNHVTNIYTRNSNGAQSESGSTYTHNSAQHRNWEHRPQRGRTLGGRPSLPRREHTPPHYNPAQSGGWYHGTNVSTHYDPVSNNTYTEYHDGRGTVSVTNNFLGSHNPGNRPSFATRTPGVHRSYRHTDDTNSIAQNHGHWDRPSTTRPGREAHHSAQNPSTSRPQNTAHSGASQQHSFSLNNAQFFVNGSDDVQYSYVRVDGETGQQSRHQVRIRNGHRHGASDLEDPLQHNIPEPYPAPWEARDDWEVLGEPPAPPYQERFGDQEIQLPPPSYNKDNTSREILLDPEN
ncbi:hypothetical protein BDP27DRAFT_1424106 [Rhodocollybia butyracea]|uniref:Uncharacterized protein n=1 Tax=Rhodocollybia butyracea TaxID=206335 RepID=A0A9P5PLT1_9AGAR|nr:hypothetical protein BDP27DRAFT_1424106 [Rhodocollybia butyracea]